MQRPSSLLRMILVGVIAIMVIASWQSPASAQQKGQRLFSPFIIGGEDAKPGEFPWMVALLNPDDGSQFCGGTLIDKSWVLTAAHCFFNNNNKQDTFEANVNILAGTIDLTNNTGQKIAVKKILLRNYDGDKHDIALLQLAEPAKIDDKTIATISLNTAPDFPQLGTLTTVTGWGATNPDGTGDPKVLQKVSVPISACDSDVDSKDYICAGGTTLKDSCQGDSGGPLVVATTDSFIQVGVTSFGGDVCGKLGAYTRISTYQKWVADILSGAKSQ